MVVDMHICIKPCKSNRQAREFVLSAKRVQPILEGELSVHPVSWERAGILPLLSSSHTATEKTQSIMDEAKKYLSDRLLSEEVPVCIMAVSSIMNSEPDNPRLV